MQHENLWAPWRMPYIQGFESQKPVGPSESKRASGADEAGRPCFLCEAAKTTPPSEQARQRLVLLRDSRGIILLNLYPYTNGHLLIAPNEHVADLVDLSPAQRGNLMELTALGQEVLRTAINPQGFNVGINLGRCAGAGLPGHLHVHIVPRWNGDTNFMQTVGRIRVIPDALENSYARLSEAMQKMK